MHEWGVFSLLFLSMLPWSLPVLFRNHWIMMIHGLSFELRPYLTNCLRKRGSHFQLLSFSWADYTCLSSRVGIMRNSWFPLSVLDWRLVKMSADAPICFTGRRNGRARVTKWTEPEITGIKLLRWATNLSLPVCLPLCWIHPNAGASEGIDSPLRIGEMSGFLKKA